MSRAFVKEPDGPDPVEPLPDRPVSPHPNLVTPQGLQAIDAQLDDLRQRQAQAQAAGDRAALAQIGRDARYWSARRATAQLVTPPEHPAEVSFGTEVTFTRGDGRRQTYRIVGEDEAEPARGTLSHVAPVARALLGKQVGDVVEAAGAELEIMQIR